MKVSNLNQTKFQSVTYTRQQTPQKQNEDVNVDHHKLDNLQPSNKLHQKLKKISYNEQYAANPKS